LDLLYSYNHEGELIDENSKRGRLKECAKSVWMSMKEGRLLSAKSELKESLNSLLSSPEDVKKAGERRFEERKTDGVVVQFSSCADYQESSEYAQGMFSCFSSSKTHSFTLSFGS
jgi:hypothetical protein